MAEVPEPLTADIGRTTIGFGLSDGSTFDVASLWLREMCSCGGCRYEATGRRRVEALHSPLDLRVTSIEVVGSELGIDWSDGHRGRVPVADLLAAHRLAPPSASVTWASERNDDLPFFEYGKVTANGRAELEWLESIERIGFAIMSGVPTSREAMRGLAESIGPVRASNYGPDWAIDAVVDPIDAVVSSSGLSPHTDLPYRQLPPGLQFLLSVVADVAGGASTLVDGHRIAAVLRRDEPHHWIALVETPVCFRFSNGEVDFRIDAPVLALGPDHEPTVIRHAPGLLGALDHRPSHFEPLYAALRRFTELTNDPAFQVVHRLAPGELLAFDNHRLLHGRQAFDLGDGGHRHLLGNYLDRDDLSSRIRSLRADHDRTAALTPQN